MIGTGQNGAASVAVDLTAATAVAVASGYAVFAIIGLSAWSAAAALAAFAAAVGVLSRIDDAPGFALAEFEPPPITMVAQPNLPELLLTDLAELVLTDCVEEEDPLLLDDLLDAPEVNSQVIRLFDPRLLPTAGELHDRIEERLHGARSYPDATAELHQALSDLRSALR